MRRPLPLAASALGLLACLGYLGWVAPARREAQEARDQLAAITAVDAGPVADVVRLDVAVHDAGAPDAARPVARAVRAPAAVDAAPAEDDDDDDDGIRRLTAPRPVWERLVLPGLRRWFGEADAEVALGLLMDMCQDEMTIVIDAADRPRDDGHDAIEDVVSVAMENRHVVRDRLIELSRGKASKADIRAFMKSHDFAEACTNVAREKDGGL